MPNSQILVNPPAARSLDVGDGADNGETDSPVMAESKEWRTELFLHPGDWIPWVGAAVVGTVLALIFVVVGLNEREKVGSGNASRLMRSGRMKRRGKEHCTRSTFKLCSVLLGVCIHRQIE